jgi:hypothetical protein
MAAAQGGEGGGVGFSLGSDGGFCGRKSRRRHGWSEMASTTGESSRFLCEWLKETTESGHGMLNLV